MTEWRTSACLLVCALSLASLSTSESSEYKSSTTSDRSAVASSNQGIHLRGATVFVGDGSPPIESASILIRGPTIEWVGRTVDLSSDLNLPVVDTRGMTIIPGFVGMHNHTHMPGKRLLQHEAPLLYLAAGVTTMTTAGSADATGELRLVDSIRRGEIPGPEIFPSAPYVTGFGGNAPMEKPENAAAARKFVDNWVDRGIGWFKLYRHTEPEIAKAIIEQAHLRGAKVTGHLCSITYTEAAAMGIDSLEHGINPATDFVLDKPKGECVSGRAAMLKLEVDDPRVVELTDRLIGANVTLTSTLAILESGFPHRPQADARALRLMTKAQRRQYFERQTTLAERKDALASRAHHWDFLLQFERQFVERGGHLVAGPDTGRHVFPSYGDQRNFLLLLEAGFGVEQVVKIMSNNGAKALGISERTGRIAEGMEADLIVIDGDLRTEPDTINNPRWIYSDGVAFNPQELIQRVENYLSAGDSSG